MKLIARANRVGRIDAYVQSTDKNFCVPVGGCVIAGPLATLAGSEYAGRASMAPILDLFITMLGMGLAGYKRLLKEREEQFVRFKERIKPLEALGLKLLDSGRNEISVALRLNFAENNNPKYFGSMLFTRGLTGHRVCSYSSKITTPDCCAVGFANWGQHIDKYLCDSYITFAVGILSSEEDAEEAIRIVTKTARELQKQKNKKK
jgi:O-phospho-L-seryl-tRNASec:L-selenocysteinyl-tRNA synthase